MMKNHFKKALVMSKKDNEVFENSKCWICNNTYLSGHVKARNDFHITRKYRGLVYRDCGINFKLNQ